MSTQSLSSSSMLSGGSSARLGRSLVWSALLHGSIVAAVLFWPGEPVRARPPIYKVNLVGAPAGQKAIGVVTPVPSTAAPSQAAAPSGVERPPEEQVAPPVTKAPERAVPKATPTPSRTAKAGSADAPKVTKQGAAPQAGSTAGGKGADVVSVRTDGIEFPSPGYLQNILRQVYVRFRPDRRFDSRALRAEISFLISRDGKVSDIRVEQSSGEYRFDLDARSAIESAGSAMAFGPLPAEWPDDVLRVYFNFTPERAP